MKCHLCYLQYLIKILIEFVTFFYYNLFYIFSNAFLIKLSLLSPVEKCNI